MSSSEEEDSLIVSDEAALPRLSRSATIERRGELFVINRDFDPGRMFDPQAVELETLADKIYTDSMKLSARANRFAIVYKYVWWSIALFIMISGVLIGTLAVEDKKKSATDYVVSVLGYLTTGSMGATLVGKVAEHGVEYKKQAMKLKELGMQASHDKLEVKDPAELYQRLNKASQKLNNLDLEMYQIGMGDSGKRAEQLAEKSATARDSAMSSPERNASSSDERNSDERASGERNSGGRDNGYSSDDYDSDNQSNDETNGNIFDLSNIQLQGTNKGKGKSKDKPGNQHGDRRSNRKDNKKSQSVFNMLKFGGKSSSKVGGGSRSNGGNRSKNGKDKGKGKRRHSRSLDDIYTDGGLNGSSSRTRNGSNNGSNNESNSDSSSRPNSQPNSENNSESNSDGSPRMLTTSNKATGRGITKGVNNDKGKATSRPLDERITRKINDTLGGDVDSRDSTDIVELQNSDEIETSIDGSDNKGRFRIRTVTPPSKSGGSGSSGSSRTNTRYKGKGKEKDKGRSEKKDTDKTKWVGKSRGVTFKLEDEDSGQPIDIRSTSIISNPSLLLTEDDLNVYSLNNLHISPSTDDLRLTQMEEGRDDPDDTLEEDDDEINNDS